MPGARYGYKVGQGPQLVGIFPVDDLRDGIGTRDEVELRFGPLRMYVTQRIDGEGGAVPIDINSANGELRVRGGCNHGHQVAMLTDRCTRLLIGHAGRHKNNFVKTKRLRNLAGCDQMPVVNGVEGATHHANFDAIHRTVDHSEPSLVVGRVPAGCRAAGLVAVAVCHITKAVHNKAKEDKDNGGDERKSPCGEKESKALLFCGKNDHAQHRHPPN